MRRPGDKPILSHRFFAQDVSIAAARRSQPESVAKFSQEWRLYARSASDDKAPIVALCARSTRSKTTGRSPTGMSASSLTARRRRAHPASCRRSQSIAISFRADAMVILDGPAHSSGRRRSPTARGIVTLNLTVFGPKAGVHSGNYGIGSRTRPSGCQRFSPL